MKRSTNQQRHHSVFSNRKVNVRPPKAPEEAFNNITLVLVQRLDCHWYALWCISSEEVDTFFAEDLSISGRRHCHWPCAVENMLPTQKRQVWWCAMKKPTASNLGVLQTNTRNIKKQQQKDESRDVTGLLVRFISVPHCEAAGLLVAMGPSWNRMQVDTTQMDELSALNLIDSDGFPLFFRRCVNLVSRFWHWTLD